VLVNGRTADLEVMNSEKKTPAPFGVQASKSKIQKYYALVAAAAFFAAFAALAAVEALRRRLVFGGVAGASPISSAVMMLVTKSLGP
jgi:ABC-type glycerol-3-phosphate transport system permease component